MAHKWTCTWTSYISMWCWWYPLCTRPTHLVEVLVLWNNSSRDDISLHSGHIILFDYPVFDGIMFLPYKRYRKDVRKAVEEIRNFPSRPSDILICASMKSGMIAFHKCFCELKRDNQIWIKEKENITYCMHNTVGINYYVFSVFFYL
jgi:hypothetical protein